MSQSRLLIVDDEQGIRQSLAGVLGDEGYHARAVPDAAACLKALHEERFDLVLLDIWLPDRDGLELLSAIQQQPAPPTVVMISGHGNVETAVRATKLGAFDFLEKPLSIDKTLLTIRHALEQRQLQRENRHLRQNFAAAAALIGESVPLRALRQQIAIMAPTNGRVLIFGESGVGKELVARALHAQSERRLGPFVDLNCAAIPEELIESELFGHVQGALGVAGDSKEGKFNRADQGTLFLDEVGDMSLKTQAKVMRTLDDGVFEVLGSNTPMQCDVRIVASTNKNLEEEIGRGNFREDLFYRLNVIPFFVPPLRERREDIPALARHFLVEFARAYGRKCHEFSPEALGALQAYHWPGNVRELRNLVERLAILTPTARVIDKRHLPPLAARESTRARTDLAAASFTSLHEARSAYEREYIQKKLEENAGNMTRTAEVLGLERSHLYRKMKSLGMSVT